MGTSSVSEQRIGYRMTHLGVAPCPRIHPGTPGRQQGFTLIELMIVLAIIATLAAMAIPVYSEFITQVRIKRAIIELRMIADELDEFAAARGDYPKNLSEIGRHIKDPWGREYRYLSHKGLKGKGSVRKDKSTNPINTDYDLYSIGKDGKTALPLTSAHGRDDVVRGLNGKYYGLGKDF